MAQLCGKFGAVKDMADNVAQSDDAQKRTSVGVSHEDAVHFAGGQACHNFDQWRIRVCLQEPGKVLRPFRAQNAK